MLSVRSFVCTCVGSQFPFSFEGKNNRNWGFLNDLKHQPYMMWYICTNTRTKPQKHRCRWTLVFVLSPARNDLFNLSTVSSKRTCVLWNGQGIATDDLLDDRHWIFSFSCQRAASIQKRVNHDVVSTEGKARIRRFAPLFQNWLIINAFRSMYIYRLKSILFSNLDKWDRIYWSWPSVDTWYVVFPFFNTWCTSN